MCATRTHPKFVHPIEQWVCNVLCGCSRAGNDHHSQQFEERQNRAL